MTKNIFFLILFLGISLNSRAQSTTDGSGAELVATPPAVASPTNTVVSEPAVAKPSPIRKIQYGLAAGSQFSRIFGTATYLEPSVMFPVTKRFSGFASFTMLTGIGMNSNFIGADPVMASYTPYRSQRYLINAGGNYQVNERLHLTGSIWRDLSRNPMPASLNVLTPGATNGMLLRANYKVSDHISISGGLRFTNGNPYNSLGYYPGAPFGY